MTSVIMIAPLNAENFESGDASDGQVLTADGAGGATFADVPGLPDYSNANPGDVLTVFENRFGNKGVGWYALNFTSGNASDGQVLTADGAGGTSWQTPVGGGGIPFLGNVGQPDTAPTGAEISAAYTSTTGEAPVNGTIAALVDNGGPEFSLAIYWSDQGIWYRVAFGVAFS